MSNSSLIVDGITNKKQMPKKKSVYNKEGYEQNKEEILKYRRERQERYKYFSEFTLYFD